MNADAESRKAQTGALFSALASSYDPLGTFAHFGRRLVAMVGVEDGQHVLDVASGRGAVLFPAAECVGAAGDAIGIDLADGMARATNAEAARRGSRARIRIMDAEHLDFPDATFDRVLCGFGVMFFPTVSRALREFRRVLKPGGRLGISTWQVAPADTLRMLLREMGLWTGSAGPVRFDEADALTLLLEQAGFGNIRVASDTTPVVVSDIDAYWETARSGGTRASLDALSPAQREQVRAILAERLRPYRRSDGIHVEATALLAVANR